MFFTEVKLNEHESPYQGVDANHQEVFLPYELAGTTARLHLQIWSGLERVLWVDAEGRALQAQRSGAGWIVEVAELPSMGFAAIRFEVKPYEIKSFLIDFSG